ncbi:MAG TPA: hypothetical protein GX697_00265 [Firmicutes bacterium]|nr:hypothetical protein [Bacillota bacterium]
MSGGKYSQVIGLQVIDANKGKLLGKVAALPVDSAGRKVAYFEVKGKDGEYHLPLELVKGMGPDALVMDGTTVPEKEDPFPGEASGQELVGKKVFSEKGVYAGTVTDFSFNREGNLTSLALALGPGKIFLKDEKLLPASYLVTIGRDYLIIKENFAAGLQEEGRPRIDNIMDKGKQLSHSLEVRAIDFALNKTVKQNIYSPEGNLIIAGGEKITSATIDKARETSRLPQLLIAAGVGEILDALDISKEKLDAGSKKLLDFWESIKAKTTTRTGAKEPGEGNPVEETGGKKAEEETPPEEELAQRKRAERETRETEEPSTRSFDWEENLQEKTSPATEPEEIFQQLLVYSREAAAKIEAASKNKINGYLINKKAADTLLSPNGEVLVIKGQLIDEAVLKKVEAAGLLNQLFLKNFGEEALKQAAQWKNTLENFLRNDN